MAAAARHAKHLQYNCDFCVRAWSRLNMIWYSFGMSNFYRINTDTRADRSYSFVRLRHTQSAQRHWMCMRTSETKQVISHEKPNDRIGVCVCVRRSDRCSLNVIIIDTMEAKHTQHTLPWTPHACGRVWVSCWKWLRCMQRRLANGEFKLSNSLFPFELNEFLLVLRWSKWHFMLRSNSRPFFHSFFCNFAIEYLNRIMTRLCIGNKWVLSLLHVFCRVLQFCWIEKMLSQQLENSNQRIGICDFGENAVADWYNNVEGSLKT